jgi:hypothetical protein
MACTFVSFAGKFNTNCSSLSYQTLSSKLSGSVAKLGNLTACPYLDMECPIGELSIQKRIELLLVNIPSLEDLIHHAEDWITTFRGGAAVLLGK